MRQLAMGGRFRSLRGLAPISAVNQCNLPYPWLSNKNAQGQLFFSGYLHILILRVLRVLLTQATVASSLRKIVHVAFYIFI